MKRLAAIALMMLAVTAQGQTRWMFDQWKLAARPSAAAVQKWYELIPSLMLAHDWSVADPGTGPYTDLSPSGVNTGFSATATAPIWYTNGLYFYSTSTCVFHPDNATTVFGNGLSNYPFTVMFWTKHINPNSFGRIIAKADKGSSAGRVEWAISTGPGTNSVRFVLYSGANAAIYINHKTTETLAITSGWHHVAAVCGGGTGTGTTQNMRIYVDGIVRPSLSLYAQPQNFVAVNNTESSIDIGLLFRTDVRIPCSNIIDMVAISSIDLPSNTIKSVVDLTKAGRE